MTNSAQKGEKKEQRKQSIKVDFLIAALYFVIAGIMYMTLIFRWDMMMYILPYGLILTVTIVFLSYIRTIIRGIGAQSQEKSERKE